MSNIVSIADWLVPNITANTHVSLAPDASVPMLKPRLMAMSSEAPFGSLGEEITANGSVT